VSVLDEFPDLLNLLVEQDALPLLVKALKTASWLAKVKVSVSYQNSL